MSETTTKTADQSADFATSVEGINAGKDVFGMIEGKGYNGQEVRTYVDFKERLPLNRLRPKLGLPAGDYVLTTGHDGEHQFEFTIPQQEQAEQRRPQPEPRQQPQQAPSNGGQPQAQGRPHYPQQQYQQPQRHSAPSQPQPSMDSYYQKRCAKLEGELHDADRKNRELTDELIQAKRELSKDKTEELLRHQQEMQQTRERFRDKIDDLKDKHRREVRSLENEIAELEKEALKMELTTKSGQDLSNRIMDALEENAPMLLQVLMSLNGGQPQQPQPQQASQNGQQQAQQPQPMQVPTIQQIKAQLPNVSDEEAQQIQDDIKQEIQQKQQANGQAQQAGQPQPDSHPDNTTDRQPTGSGQPEKGEGDSPSSPQPSLNESFADGGGGDIPVGLQNPQMNGQQQPQEQMEV